MDTLEHLETQFWSERIVCHPELEDKCPWNQLGPTDWHDILMEHPEFIKHAPKKITFSFMSTNQWLEVLIVHPELDVYVPSAKSLFNRDSDAIGKLWGALLSRHPQFAKYEPWKHLRREDWRKVLSQQPQFITNYEKDRSQKNTWQFALTTNDQAEVIACQPSLFNRFKSDDFQGKAWETVLANQPQFRSSCNLNKIGPLYLGALLRRYPEWLDYCDPYSMAPDDILRIAENYPAILDHYDLEQFKEIGKGDTPWIEKYPCLVPYTCWDFSYSYWDALLTRLSSWQNDGKRPNVDALATRTAKSSNKEVSLPGRSFVKKHGSLKRTLPKNPKEKNLRNSIDSIMDYRYWCELGGPINSIEPIPLRIRNILMDKNLTYEQLMIKMNMMSEEDCGMLFYGLFVVENDEFLDRMLEDDIDQTVRQVPAKFILPLAIMYSSSNLLYSLMVEIKCHDANAIKDFRDNGGNNAWHYFFFRNPLYHPSQKTQFDRFEHGIYDFLKDFACSPDTPNDMGFSYSQINQAMGRYLKTGEQ